MYLQKMEDIVTIFKCSDKLRQQFKIRFYLEHISSHENAIFNWKNCLVIFDVKNVKNSFSPEHRGHVADYVKKIDTNLMNRLQPKF